MAEIQEYYAALENYTAKYSDSSEDTHGDHANQDDSSSVDENGLTCTWEPCGQPISYLDAVTWHGDGQVYCIDCMTKYQRAERADADDGEY